MCCELVKVTDTAIEVIVKHGTGTEDHYKCMHYLDSRREMQQMHYITNIV